MIHPHFLFGCNLSPRFRPYFCCPRPQRAWRRRTFPRWRSIFLLGFLLGFVSFLLFSFPSRRPSCFDPVPSILRRSLPFSPCSESAPSKNFIFIGVCKDWNSLADRLSALSGKTLPLWNHEFICIVLKLFGID
jgi:hypothetical protein